MRRLLHDVAERACQLELPTPLEHSSLNAQHIAADLSVRETVHDADLICVGYALLNYRVLAEVFTQILRFHDDLLYLRVLDDLLRRFAADVGDPALEAAHSRFAGVAVDDLKQRLVRDLKPSAVQPAALNLLRKHMLLRYRELFGAGVGIHPYDVHTVDEAASEPSRACSPSR